MGHGHLKWCHPLSRSFVVSLWDPSGTLQEHPHLRFINTHTYIKGKFHRKCHNSDVNVGWHHGWKGPGPVHHSIPFACSQSFQGNSTSGMSVTLVAKKKLCQWVWDLLTWWQPYNCFCPNRYCFELLLITCYFITYKIQTKICTYTHKYTYTPKAC